MSLLAALLATADQVEVEDLHIKVKDISDMILKLKREVMETMENSYIKFLPLSDENNELLTRATNLHNELTDLHTRIESQIKRELSDSTGELHDLKTTLQQTDLSINIATKLYKVHQCFIDACEKQEALHFYEAALKLKETETLLSNAEDELKSLDVHEALNTQLSQMQNDFLISVLENWKPCIKYNEVAAHHYKKNKEITVSIIKDDLKSDVVRGLHYYSYLIMEINKFGDKFLHNVLMLVIDQKSLVKITDNAKYSTLHIETKNFANNDCVDVIKNLVVIFNFLFSQFDIIIEDGKSFVSELGERISNEFVEYFIKNCLAKAVPKCQEKLDSYDHVIKSLLVLGKLLHDKEFLRADDSRLLEYSQNVGVLITNKICDSYIESARVLMKQDLHDMMEAGTFVGNAELNDTLHGNDVTAFRKIKQFRPPDSDHYVYVSELSLKTYQFPVCQISKSAFELIELVKTLLDESAKSKSKFCAMKLFNVARNIFRLYCDIVPLHHRKMLDTLPKQAALFSNNCYYLSHNLLTLGSTFKSELPATFQGDMITFMDLIDSLIKISNKVLLNQINIQKKQMIDILRDSGLVTVTESPDFPAGIEKAMRQCIRQLLLLKNEWYQVLPINTYCESMGSLLSKFVQELIDRVCSFVDIPAHTASELVRVFTIVKEKTPAIFPDPNEVFMYVRNWSKFIELVKLLGASLQDVEERWSDRKGPLAQDFTADQVKLLVKALFQISDKRADLLARIK